MPTEENREIQGGAALGHPGQPAQDVAREAVRRAIAEAVQSGVPQSQIARESGLAGSAVSSWLKGTYRGNLAGVQSKLSAWLAARRAQADSDQAAGPQWVDTPTGQAIARALDRARMRPGIAVVYGGAGVGKTTALRRYAQTFNNVWIITPRPSSSSMVSILRDIGAALALNARSWQSRALSGDIIQALTETRGLLVIDEAQHLTVQALEEVRSIQDAAQMGLAFCGNETVFSRLTGGSQRADFAQLKSRVIRRLRIAAPGADDVGAILAAWNITGTQERQYAHQIASLPGGLRGLVNTLEDAATAAHGFGRAVDAKMMRTVWAELGSTS